MPPEGVIDGGDMCITVLDDYGFFTEGMSSGDVVLILCYQIPYIPGVIRVLEA